jgi:hypothetical protein
MQMSTGMRKDKHLKESSVVGMCFVTATSCTISMEKVNVITMESDFMRNRCCGCKSVKTKELSPYCKALSLAEFGISLGYFWFSTLVLIF